MNSRGGLPPPPSSASRRHSTDLLHGSPTDRPWTAHGLPTDCPWTAHGSARPDVFRLLGAFLGDFGGSFSLHELCKRVLGALPASNLALSCSFEPSETLFWSSGKRFGEKFRTNSIRIRCQKLCKHSGQPKHANCSIYCILRYETHVGAWPR